MICPTCRFKIKKSSPNKKRGKFGRWVHKTHTVYKYLIRPGGKNA